MASVGPKEHGRTNQLGDVAMDEPLAFGISHGVSDLAVKVADRAGGQPPVGLASGAPSRRPDGQAG